MLETLEALRKIGSGTVGRVAAQLPGTSREVVTTRLYRLVVRGLVVARLTDGRHGSKQVLVYEPSDRRREAMQRAVKALTDASFVYPNPAVRREVLDVRDELKRWM